MIKCFKQILILYSSNFVDNTDQNRFNACFCDFNNLSISLIWLIIQLLVIIGAAEFFICPAYLFFFYETKKPIVVLCNIIILSKNIWHAIIVDNDAFFSIQKNAKKEKDERVVGFRPFSILIGNNLLCTYTQHICKGKLNRSTGQQDIFDLVDDTTSCVFFLRIFMCDFILNSGLIRLSVGQGVPHRVRCPHSCKKQEKTHVKNVKKQTCDVVSSIRSFFSRHINGMKINPVSFI